ncbi:MAG: hypothetical protein MKZ86_06485 [Alphaproteobacteria bacterium]|nr:hypothetical protein [Alphaproteobacteria bacterium]
MISVYIKLFKIYFLVIIFLSSCEYNSISDFDKDIEELIDWSLINETKYQSINYTPITSETLAELISLEEYSNLVQPKNGILIGYFIFKSDKIFLTESNKDLIILISKAQKYEDFNILIQSNDIKSNLNKVIDEIKRILISNGVKKYNIKINSKEDLNKDMVIKLIKLS